MEGMWWFWAWSHIAAVSGAAVSAPEPPAIRLGTAVGTRPDTPPYPTGDGGPRVERGPSRVDPPAGPPRPRVALLDEDVLRALESRQPSFLRCYRIAQRKDPFLFATRVRLKVRVGPEGSVEEAVIDGGTSVALDECIV